MEVRNFNNEFAIAFSKEADSKPLVEFKITED